MRFVLWLIESGFLVLLLLAILTFGAWRQVRHASRLLLTEEEDTTSLTGLSDYGFLQRISDQRHSFGRRQLHLSYRSAVWDGGGLPYESWIAWPRFWAGTFVFIGLLGTVLGVALAMNGLGGSFSSGTGNTIRELNQVQTQVGELLKHLKSAFYCTLGGIVATLCIALLNSLYLVRARALEERLASIAYSRCIPLHYEKREERTSKKLLEVVTALGASVTRLQETSASLESGAQELSSALVPTALHFEATAQHTSQITEGVNAAALKMIEHVEDMRDSLRLWTDEVNRFGAEFKENNSNFAAVFGRSTETISDISQQFKETLQSLDHSIEILNSERATFGELSLGWSEVTKKTATQMVASAKAFEKETKANTSALHKVTQDLVADSTQTRQIMEQTLRELRGQIESMAERISGESASAIEGLHTVFDQQGRALTAELKQAAEKVRDIADMVELRHQVVKLYETVQEAKTAGQDEKFTFNQRELSRITDELTKLNDRLGASSKETLLPADSKPIDKDDRRALKAKSN